MPLESQVQNRNPIVEGILADYGQRSAFIADMVAPIQFVDSRSGKIEKLLRRDLTRGVDSKVGPDGQPNRYTFGTGTASYTVEDYALVDFVSRSASSNADQPLQPLREQTAMNLMEAILRGREKRVANLLTTNANYNTTVSATAVWSDQNGGDPLADVLSAQESLAAGGGESTTLRLVMSLELWNDLKRHPALQAGGMNRPVVTPNEAAERLGVDEIVIGSAQEDTANPGASSGSFSRIWSTTKAALVRVPTGQITGKTRMFARTLRFRGDPSEGRPREANGIVSMSWDDPMPGVTGGEWLKVGVEDDEKVIQDDMGVLITGAG